MLFGKYASRKSEARFPILWENLVLSVPVSVQPPSGLTAYDFAGNRRPALSGTSLTAATAWSSSGSLVGLNFSAGNQQASYRTIDLGTTYSIAFRMFVRADQTVVIGGAASPQSYALYPHASVGWYHTVQGTFTLHSSITDAAVPWLNRWTSACVVRRRTSVEWFVNGTSFGTQALGANNSMPLSTFSGFAGGSLCVNGMLSEIAYWTRPISASEAVVLHRYRNAVHVAKRRPIAFGGLGTNRRRRLLVGA